MTKPTLALICPIFSVAGYGIHSRILSKALLKLDKYDLKIVPTKWGTTPQTALDQSNPDHVPILRCIVPQLTEQPDISIQITVPNEFERIGKVSIGITALTEANITPPTMLEGCNKVDLVLVPSHFTKSVLTETTIEKRDNRTNQIVGTLKFDKICEVLCEGIDLTVYNKTNTVKSPIIEQINSIPESFLYLFVGHFLDARFNEDRKNVSGLIHTFLETFKNKKKMPALVLKTSGAGFSNVERDNILDKIQQIQEMIRDNGYNGKLPSIYVINGELSDDEMNVLYNHPKVKSFVSFTKGEAWGLPLAEFATTGKPIICSNYSGPVDFLKPEHSFLIPGALTNIDPSAANAFLPKEGQWFTVNYPMTSQILKHVFENYEKCLEKSRKQPKYIKDNFSLDKMTERLDELLTQYATVQPKPTLKLNLPQLKKY